jgi:hydrogenase maturation protease
MTHYPWLVIGYGSDLRGDDAAGPRVAAAVADWGLPDVRALAMHQLLPELAPLLAEARAVFIVDVALPSEVSEFRASPLLPTAVRAGLGHFGDPGALLRLTDTLFGRVPEAWLLLLPGRRFGFGEALSPQTECAMDAALGWIRSRVAPDGARHAFLPFDASGPPAPTGDPTPAREELSVSVPRPHRQEPSG